MSNLDSVTFCTLDHDSLQTINGGDVYTGLALIGTTLAICGGIAVALASAPVVASVAGGAAIGFGVLAAATTLSVGIVNLFGHEI